VVLGSALRALVGKQKHTELSPVCMLTSERSELPSTYRPRTSTSRGRAEDAARRAENA